MTISKQKLDYVKQVHSTADKEERIFDNVMKANKTMMMSCIFFIAVMF